MAAPCKGLLNIPFAVVAPRRSPPPAAAAGQYQAFYLGQFLQRKARLSCDPGLKSGTEKTVFRYPRILLQQPGLSWGILFWFFFGKDVFHGNRSMEDFTTSFQ